MIGHVSKACAELEFEELEEYFVDEKCTLGLEKQGGILSYIKSYSGGGLRRDSFQHLKQLQPDQLKAV